MSGVACPFCGARGTEECSTKNGRNHASRDRAIYFDSLCGAWDTVGSYPGERSFSCERTKGHDGEHRATHEWTEEETNG